MKEVYKDTPTISFDMMHKSVLGNEKEYHVEIYTHSTPEDSIMKGMVRAGLVGTPEEEMSEAKFIWDTDRYTLPMVTVTKSGIKNVKKFNVGRTRENSSMQKAREFICASMSVFQNSLDEYHPSLRKVTNLSIKEDSLFGKIERAVKSGHFKVPYIRMNNGKQVQVLSSVVNFHTLDDNQRGELCEYKNWIDGFKDLQLMDDFEEFQRKAKEGISYEDRRRTEILGIPRMEGKRAFGPKELVAMGFKNDEMLYRICTTFAVDRKNKKYLTKEEFARKIIGGVIGVEPMSNLISNSRDVSHIEEDPAALQRLVQLAINPKPVLLDVEKLRKMGVEDKNINRLLYKTMEMTIKDVEIPAQREVLKKQMKSYLPKER